MAPAAFVPLDRNAMVRAMMVTRALMRHQEKGKAYGKIRAETLAVLTALLWRFHNAATSQCFPVIRGDRRGRRLRQEHGLRGARLEHVGALSWVNRIKRVREYDRAARNPMQRRCAEPGRRQRFQQPRVGKITTQIVVNGRIVAVQQHRASFAV